MSFHSTLIALRFCSLVANRSVDAILKQCLTFSPEYVALMDGASARKLEHHLIQAGSKTQVVHSMEDVARIVSHVKVDCVMAAIGSCQPSFHAGCCKGRQAYFAR